MVEIVCSLKSIAINFAEKDIRKCSRIEWVFIYSATPRRFLSVPITCFHGEIRKKITDMVCFITPVITAVDDIIFFIFYFHFFFFFFFWGGGGYFYLLFLFYLFNYLFYFFYFYLFIYYYHFYFLWIVCLALVWLHFFTSCCVTNKKIGLLTFISEVLNYS